MLFAKRFSLFCIKSLSFQVLLTCRAIEALGVPILVQGFNPAIAWLNRELASIALSLKHGLPVFLAVSLSIFNMELSTAYWLTTVETKEALGMESIFQSIDTFPQNCGPTLATPRRKEFLVVLLAKELTAFFYEPYA